MKRFINRRILKCISVYLIVNLLFQVLYPSIAYALTSGPTQPELHGFQPIETSEMVDLFTGDMNYNLPLLDVGGYPVNLSYHAGITPDQEASWVGLGWSLNTGVINRSLRGLPDDFNGDVVTHQVNKKNNITVGVGVNADLELLGFSISENFGGSTTVGVGVSFNNYNGPAMDFSANPSISVGKQSAFGLNAGLGIDVSSEDGVSISPSVSLTAKTSSDQKKDVNPYGGIQIGCPYNSRTGLKGLTLTGTTGLGKGMELGGASFTMGNFASPSYTPTVGSNNVTGSASFTIKTGASFFTVFGNASISGHFSMNSIDNSEQPVPSFGYLYAHDGEAASTDNKSFDFNREKDGSYTPNTPNIALAQHTFDVYSASGQGVSGTFRPSRSDIGTVYDKKTTILNGGFDISGGDLGGGNTVQFGLNIRANVVTGSSERWHGGDDGNDASSVLSFKGSGSNDLYEPSYFKEIGDLTVESDPDFFNAVGQFDPIEVKLNRGSGRTSPVFLPNEDESKAYQISQTTRNKRERRNQLVQYLTADEASVFGLERSPMFYEVNKGNPSGYSINYYNRKSRPDHHISEISVLRNDGMRYVYGIPTYNSEQTELTFAVNSPDANTEAYRTGLIPFSDNDITIDNKNSVDHYFQKTQLPPYAHSYLLTAVVSPDYVDRTGDGPSDDDLGTYTKFSYVRAYTDYQWRTPYHNANFNEGFKSDKTDDKASIIYGKKEIWYLHSIETRTHIAEFQMEDRNDGLGADGIKGDGQDLSKPLKLLRKISLYAKPDREKEIKFSSHKATPIKEVHFDYDYSLCPGKPANAIDGAPVLSTDNYTAIDNYHSFTNEPNQLSGGKLTLKKIYFTFGTSKKGKMSPYGFTYADMDHDDVMDVNYPYDIKAYDRWGNHKPNNPNDILNAEFPYANQDPSSVHKHAAAWSLTSIKLPSGGKINIDYEADDYAFVQNRRAMKMFRIESSGNSTSLPSNTSGDLVNNDYLFFKLDEIIPVGANAKDIIGNQYLKEITGEPINRLYFKFLSRMNSGNYDYVPGYCEIEDYGVADQLSGESGYTYGYVKMKKVNLSSVGSVSPVSKAAVQFARINLPKIATNQSQGEPDNNMSLTTILQKFSSMVTGIRDLFQGINSRMYNSDQFGTSFIPNKSWVRLYASNYKKFGGGLRVKRISINDNWNNLATKGKDYQSMSYGQEYDYTKVDEQYGIKISSGVAAYEPLLGGDENPFRLPDVYEVERTLAPSDDLYQEQPYGESWFPAASVGYSEVIIRKIKPEGHENDIHRTATGKVVNQFYTARDFPTLTRKTELNPKIEVPGLSIGLLVSAKSTLTGSQGFVVELNDMHGKQKAQWVYQEGDDMPISGKEFIYKTKQESGQKGQLDNMVEVVDVSGKIKQAMMGVDYETIVDSRMSGTKAVTAGVSINVNSFLAGIFPIVLGAAYPENKISENIFKSISVTKIIHRSGIMDKVVAYDLGSKVSTNNLLFEEETGQVLLTQINDEFDDPIYNFTYPAHWAYKGMGPAYTNIGYTLENTTLSNIPNQNFALGDELALYTSAGTTFKAWITEIKSGGTGIKAVLNDNSEASDNYSKVKIVRSGRRNLQSLSMGSIVSMTDPRMQLQNGSKVLALAQPVGTIDPQLLKSIIDASVTVYDSHWETFCDCDYNDFAKLNPYINGQEGNYRPAGTFVFITNRKQSTLNNNTNIRKDGTYEKFTPFWQYGQDHWYDGHYSIFEWILKNQVTLYSARGQELENRDALRRYSSAVFGFNETLPTAISTNAQYKEIGFDSFEDYEFSGCAKDHFSFRDHIKKDNAGQLTNPTNGEAHSGRYSLEVIPNSETTIEKPLKICPVKDEPPVVK